MIIVDTSYSVGPGNFENHVKLFLRALVNNHQLNVSAEGSHIAIMTFSDEKNTRVQLSMHGRDKSDVKDKIAMLHYSDLAGSSTRTDLALLLANKVRYIFIDNIYLVYIYLYFLESNF